MLFLHSIFNRCSNPIFLFPSRLSRIEICISFSSFTSLNRRSRETLKPKSFCNDDSKFTSGTWGFRNSNDNLPVTTNSVEFDGRTVGETISSYANDWKRAFEFFNWVEDECEFEHSVDTYNRMIDVLGKFFEFDLAWNLIDRMSRNGLFKPDHTTFRIMFKRYVAAHMVREAIDTYDRTEEFNLKDETSFSNLVDALCEYKHVIEAEEICMGKNSAFGLNTKIYNMILRGWFKLRWWSKCREFWEDMDQKGIARDLHSYSIYMDILCKCGKPWKAVKLYKEMKKKGIKLDVVAYNTVIHAVGLLDGVDVSLRLYREMLEFGCRPNVVTYNTIMKLLCEAGRVRQAYALLDQMSEKGCFPNVITYHCLFACLNRPNEILKLFERMIKCGVHPRMDTYVMLIRKFGRWGFLRPVFIVWRKMEEHGLSPDEFAYNALIDALVTKGMVQMAQKYDKEMFARGLSAKPRNELGTKLLNETSVDEHL